MSSEVWMGFFRHMLTMLGGVLIAKGWLDESAMPELVGAVMTLVGFIWSWSNKKKLAEKVVVKK